jgi:hypothetical protein
VSLCRLVSSKCAGASSSQGHKSIEDSANGSHPTAGPTQGHKTHQTHNTLCRCVRVCCRPVDELEGGRAAQGDGGQAGRQGPSGHNLSVLTLYRGVLKSGEAVAALAGSVSRGERGDKEEERRGRGGAGARGRGGAGWGVRARARRRAVQAPQAQVRAPPPAVLGPYPLLAI